MKKKIKNKYDFHKLGVKSKQDKLRGNKVYPVILHLFDLFLMIMRVVSKLLFIEKEF